MTYKNIKFEDSPVMRSLEKLAVNKGLVKPDAITKTAAPKTASLKPTENLEENILKLCSALRASGFDKHATEVETKFFNLKRAEAYAVHSETGEDVINSAHPKGSHHMEDVDGDAVFMTVIDKQKAMQDMIAKKPSGKLAATLAAANVVKTAGKISKVDAINSVKVILAQRPATQVPEGFAINEHLKDVGGDENGETISAYGLSQIANRPAFVLYQECISKFDKKIIPMMGHDKIPEPVKKAVSTYRMFIENIFKALMSSLQEAAKKGKELEEARLKASANDASAAKINIKEILPYLTKGQAANLGLGSATTFGELKAKINEVYSQIGTALQTKLAPAFNQPPFDGELKEMGNKIKEAINDSVSTLNKG